MKIRLYILLACVFLSQHMMAVYYSVNIDYKTAAAMLAAYNAEGAVELMGDESVRTMLKHYKNAEIATAGIFLTKYMDYKHLRDAGRFMRRRMPITSVSTVLSARISSPRLGM